MSNAPLSDDELPATGDPVPDEEPSWVWRIPQLSVLPGYQTSVTEGRAGPLPTEIVTSAPGTASPPTALTTTPSIVPFPGCWAETTIN